jgi:ATP-dependent helicase HrpB
VLRLDLARTVLELRAWGLRDVRGLRWLDPPPPVALAGAERLLAMLGGVGPDGALTAVGRRMLELPVEPRVARMLVEAERRGCTAEAALLAALASERDVLRGARTLGGGVELPPGRSDLLVRAELLADAARRGFARADVEALGLDPGAARTVERVRRQLLAVLGGRGRDGGPAAEDDLLRCVLAGFPDRVARRRGTGSPRAVMVGGTGVVLGAESVVHEAELFVAVDLERGTGPEGRVRLASAVEATWLAEVFPDAMRTTAELWFDPERGRVVARSRTAYRDLVLREAVRTDVDRAEAGAVLASVVRADPAGAAALGADGTALLDRLRFLARTLADLELPAPESLLADAVGDLAAGCVSLAELRAADVAAAVRARLRPAQRAALERDAPAHVALPSGRRAPIRYPPDRPPVTAARIQELFGLAATPRLARGRVPLVLEVLAPSGRPVQVTDDLASFWRTTYAEIRRELRGRYPKHDWPEDPAAGRPSIRGTTRRRSTR